MIGQYNRVSALKLFAVPYDLNRCKLCSQAQIIKAVIVDLAKPPTGGDLSSMFTWPCHGVQAETPSEYYATLTARCSTSL